MRAHSIAATATLGCALLLTQGAAVQAAEIKVLSAEALRPVLTQLSSEFERSSGHKLSIAYATAGAARDRIQGGETPDVTLITAPQVEQLAKQGRIGAEGRAIVAKVGVGIGVRAGASKPDVGSIEALKRALLNAKSITYADPARGGAAGIHFAQVLEKLGIAADMKAKSKLVPAGVVAVLAKGEAELGITQVSLIVGTPGLELVGPLPTELQHYTVFSAGIVTGAKQAEAGKALIKFLASPAAVAVIKANGMEPGAAQ